MAQKQKQLLEAERRLIDREHENAAKAAENAEALRNNAQARLEEIRRQQDEEAKKLDDEMTGRAIIYLNSITYILANPNICPKPITKLIEPQTRTQTLNPTFIIHPNLTTYPDLSMHVDPIFRQRNVGGKRAPSRLVWPRSERRRCGSWRSRPTT